MSEIGILQNNASVLVQLMNDDASMKKMEEMRDAKALNNYLKEECNVYKFITISIINIFN